MPSPFFSIVIPSYNHAHFLRDAIESVLNQTSGDFEAIIVDDGSSDNTEEVVDSYSDSRIRYIYQENKGLPGARNTGIKQARGEWIALLDADDSWHPQRLALFYNHIMKFKDIKLFGSPTPLKSNLPKDLNPNPPTRSIGVKEFLFESPVAASSVFVHKQCFEKVGLFTESLKSIEDRDMWLRITAYFSGLSLEIDTLVYRHHSEQMSADCQKMFYYYKLVLDNFFLKHPNFRLHKRPAYSFLYMDAGICFLKKSKQIPKGIFSLIRSLILYPISLPSEKYQKFKRSKLIVHSIIGTRLSTLGKKLVRRSLERVSAKS